MFDNALLLNSFINKIGSLIKEHGASAMITFKNKYRINLSNSNGGIYYLESGSISIYKKKDDMLLLQVKAPQIVGMFHLWSPNNYYYIRCTDECVFWVATNEVIRQVISDNNLWYESFCIVADKVQKLFEHDLKATLNSTQDIVMAHLKDIWMLPPSERKNISIYKYIMIRNHISRSAIYKIVAILINKKVITIERGCLTYLETDFFQIIDISNSNSIFKHH
ncbi:helix-turn-helix domain-containing protein [Citrobacter braakii]|uniref:helix-turn-helix domain-containing protein n=1 Tax=Citrobacter braakii TaxID=57706 RepID=UPI0024E0F493|nr:helix-turn-helix domain-containing protein [Citrobacter braakii]WOR25847.1 helix-turn-helix domain-containing protein [Citrobacter braakii]